MIALAPPFGFSGEPFRQDIPVDKLFPLPGLKAFLERFDYAMHLGAATVITGEVGTGKSTSLRAATARLHPSQYVVITVVATSGSVLELLKQICLELGAPQVSSSLARLTKTIRDMLANLTAKKQRPVLVVDEAHLVRLDVFAQLHALMQLPYDERTLMPLVLSGQNILIDRLLYHTSQPFASRIIGRTLLAGLVRDDIRAYLDHHLKLVGSSVEVPSDEAVTAIHQSSGGLLRRANALARGALLAAAKEKAPVVTAEHVRLATTEIL